MSGKSEPQSIILNGLSLQLSDVKHIAEGAILKIDPNVQKNIMASWAMIEEVSKGNRAVYGVNTGFGYLANRIIPTKDLDQLQVNLLRSHASGYGAALSIPTTRVAMALRLNVLLKGNSGVRFALCEKLCSLINEGIYPLIPEYGSVGASGDLAPLAHLALPLIGEGKVSYKGSIMPSFEALKLANITPYKLSVKEGIGLINGTQIMLATGLLPFLEAKFLVEMADRITALSYEGLVANPTALFHKIHEVRGQAGQILSARTISDQIEDSYLFDPTTQRNRIQDPYSLRCAPQIHGPTRDALQFVESILIKELNAATDNPLVFVEDQMIVSGGNFHGQYLATGFDIASIAFAEIGSVSERRLELLLNPHLSGLPPFLAPQDGLNSGYMASQYLSASLVNENKLLANPSCTDTIPGNVGIEDHVSMGMTSARKFNKIVENVRTILAIEMIAASQAIDLRCVKKLGKGTEKLYRRVRQEIPMLQSDRILSDEIQTGVEILKQLMEDCK